MTTIELIRALRRINVQTGSLVCLGCGYEHDCGIHGCHIIREAACLIQQQQTQIDRMSALVFDEKMPLPCGSGTEKLGGT